MMIEIIHLAMFNKLISDKELFCCCYIIGSCYVIGLLVCDAHVRGATREFKSVVC